MVYWACSGSSAAALLVSTCWRKGTAPGPRSTKRPMWLTSKRPAPLQAQYTIVPTPSGGAVDDAYLYRFAEGEHLLVVNASNRVKDWEHFEEHIRGFPDVELTDETGEIAMLALQGKATRDILAGLIVAGSLPEPRRNELSV